jgi:hypothetical protein
MLSMNGKAPKISTTPPFVLRLSKEERRVFQQNLNVQQNYINLHKYDSPQPTAERKSIIPACFKGWFD